METDKSLILDLIAAAEEVCDGVRDMPCGCEGCWLWRAYEDKMLEDYTHEQRQEYYDNWVCPLEDSINKIYKKFKENEENE